MSARARLGRRARRWACAALLALVGAAAPGAAGAAPFDHEHLSGGKPCAACHNDFHFGQFDGPSPPARTCAECHTVRAWAPSTVDAARHAALGAPLRGAHRSIPCARCHVGPAWVGTPTDCAACHFDLHGGSRGAACARCHGEGSWKDLSAFDHAAAGGRPLVGKHAQLPCAACHGEDGQKLRALAPAPTGEPTTAPPAPPAPPAPLACASCHTARHGARYGADCAGCHTPAGWKELSGFDHARTLFPLERRHAVLACAACHDERHRDRLSPECKSCHGDPSHGRLAAGGCEECHRPDSWHLIRYDHDRSEFPLRGAHFVTQCWKCHLNDVYTGTRSECVYCHRADRVEANAKVPGHARTSFDCKDCHKAFKW